MHPMHAVLWNFRCAKLFLPAAVLHKPGVAVLRDLCAHYSRSKVRLVQSELSTAFAKFHSYLDERAYFLLALSQGSLTMYA